MLAPPRLLPMFGLLVSTVGLCLSGCSLLQDVDQHICQDESICGQAGTGTGSAETGGTTTGGDTGVSPCTDCTLTVEYECGETANEASRLRPTFRIVNKGTEPVDLQDLTLRYYFSSETMAPHIYQCTCAFGDCDPTCADYVTGTFVEVSGENTSTALELSFSTETGQLFGLGAATDKLQGLVRNGGSADYNQANDYSFAPELTEFAELDRVTLYLYGKLVWGVEP